MSHNYVQWPEQIYKREFCLMARKLLLHLKLFWCSLNPFPLFLSPVTVTYYKLYEDWWSTILSLLYGRTFSFRVFPRNLLLSLVVVLWDTWIDYLSGDITSKFPCAIVLSYMPVHTLHKAPWLTFSTSLGQLSTILKCTKCQACVGKENHCCYRNSAGFIAFKTF